MSPAKYHFSTGSKRDAVFASGDWAQFRNRVHVDNGRAMDSNELSPRQFSLDIRHGLSNEIRALLNVQADIVAFCLYPINLLGGDDNDFSVRLKWQAFQGSSIDQR